MAQPTIQEERKLWKKGFKRVVCLDESGRGSLCGPVVAAAVMLDSRIWTNLPRISRILFGEICDKFVDIRDIKDSKKLSSKQREKIYKIVTNHPNIGWGIGKTSEKIIDKINILEATKLAMEKAIKNLKRRLKNSLRYQSHGKVNARVDFLILDGRLKLNLPLPQKSIIKADEKVLSCAIASIIAKVTRDKIMQRYHKKYPQYDFASHKGYPTKYHLKALKKYGPLIIHRKSFHPLKNLV